MPHKYFNDQFDDEEVLFLFRKHPIVMRKGLILACACLLIGPVYTMILSFARPLNPPTLSFFFLSLVASGIVGVVVLLPKWITWFFSVYIVTDQRFIQISQKGMFHKSVVDMELGQIQMVNYEVAGLQQTLFGFGTIIMQTTVGDLVIHEVHHPAAIQKKLLEVLRTRSPAAFPPEQQVDDETYEPED
jgi:membrane protein YdbS with pleckstrin-like domain